MALNTTPALGAGPALSGQTGPGSFNVWTRWSAASESVSYDHRPDGAGPGEWKVAAEFNTRPLGQNSPYDMEPVINGSAYKFEIKEPDSADSFPCGRNGRDALRPVKALIAELLGRFPGIAAHAAVPEGLRGQLLSLSTVSPDELCEGNTVKLHEACRSLLELRETLQSRLTTVPLFNPFTGERTSVSARQYAATAKVWGLTAEAIKETVGAESFSSVELLDSLTHVYIDTPDRLLSDLTSLRDIFRGYVLVLVHREKGFYLMDSPETRLTFNRITRGHPRFKVDVMERSRASPRGGRRTRTVQHSPAAGTY
jgi:hypothetical protein